MVHIMIIKNNSGAVWHIQNNGAPLAALDVAYIKAYRPAVYCNDLTGLLWCYDVELPSGRWLENIAPAGDLRTVAAFIA